MWDERYSTEEYAYGIKPNDFLKERYTAIKKGKVLSLAEGEGRNAVFLARQGYTVTAVDASLVGIEKGKKLARKYGVEVEFIHADLVDFNIAETQWDGIISIFFPLPAELRKTLYKKITKGLKHGGIFLLEAYTPEQISFNSGGGSSVSVMQSKSSLINELHGITFEHLIETNRNVVEGKYHTGMAAVVQAIAKK